jgi:AraC family ethanolamine operon transcriptional activator
MPRHRIENSQGKVLPPVTVVELRDPTAVGENIEILCQDLVQLESKPLRARQIYVRLEDSLVIFQSTNVKMRVRTSVDKGLLAYSVFGPQAEGTVNGHPIGADRMLRVKPGSQVELVVEAGYESVAFLLSPALLATHLIERQRDEIQDAPNGIDLLHTKGINGRRFFDWGKRLASTAAHHPGLFNGRKDLRAAVQIELLEMLLAALDTSTVTSHTRSHHTRQTRNRVVKLAEDFALAQTEDRLCVTDLCLATGVSERTLQYAFQEVMGMSPLAYLTRLRLHRVRKALRMGTYGSTTVSAQALKWGFWHFGDFTRAYRDCFDELPSETLQRKSLETSIRGSNIDKPDSGRDQ